MGQKEANQIVKENKQLLKRVEGAEFLEQEQNRWVRKKVNGKEKYFLSDQAAKIEQALKEKKQGTKVTFRRLAAVPLTEISEASESKISIEQPSSHYTNCKRFGDSFDLCRMRCKTLS